MASPQKPDTHKHTQRYRSEEHAEEQKKIGEDEPKNPNRYQIRCLS